MTECITVCDKHLVSTMGCIVQLFDSGTVPSDAVSLGSGLLAALVCACACTTVSTMWLDMRRSEPPEARPELLLSACCCLSCAAMGVGR